MLVNQLSNKYNDVLKNAQVRMVGSKSTCMYMYTNKSGRDSNEVHPYLHVLAHCLDAFILVCVMFL